MLFIDARHTFRQIDRAHRDFTDAQIEFLANVVRLWRDEKTESRWHSQEILDAHGFKARYSNVPGICRAASRAEIEAQGWSLNPGRYVGARADENEDVDFVERLEELQEGFERLTVEARELEGQIGSNFGKLMGAQ